jgi:Na+/H+ antiporter
MIAAFTASDSIVLFALLAAAALLLAAAQFIHVPYPILFVLGGLGLAFIPGTPEIVLSPDLVLIAILPPLLYGGAFFTSLRELRANAGSISLLAIGLVLTTMVVVAAAAHAVVPDLDWPSAFVLGAIVSPTDPTAATAIAERLGLPRQLVAVIEGESLVNDATGLVLYRFAVTAVVTGSFSLLDASARFVLNVVGGIAIGLAVAFVIRQVRRRLANPPVEITISLLSGYFGYLPAQAAGVSGVLAAVTVGVYMGWYTPELTTPQTRLQGLAVWELVFIVLNAALFGLVGLQLPSIVDALSGSSTGSLLGYALLVLAAVLAARFAWIMGSLFLSRTIGMRFRRGDPRSTGKGSLVLAWAGMRGAVSLAAALALPLTTDAHEPFPERELIIFLTFAVILGTLVGQGLTMPMLIRLLRIEEDGEEAREEAKARIAAAEAALGRLEELLGEDWVRDGTAQRLRGLYDFRRRRFASRIDPAADSAADDQSADYQRLRRELLDAEREAVVELRRAGEIDDGVMRKVVRDLDLEDARLDI